MRPHVHLVLAAWLAACAANRPATETAPQGSSTAQGGSADAGSVGSGLAAGSDAISAAAGSPGSVATTPGSVGAMCGGLTGAACLAELYCAFPSAAQCGAADQTGVCQPVPDMCAQVQDPVCGCDDTTYGNACAAAAARVSVAKAGACESAAPAGSIAEGRLCGTRGVPGSCATGLYCAYRSQCGDTDAGGVCTRRATVCTRIYQPVCGCDGKNYGNACEAASAGVSVRAPGTCAS